MRVVLGTVLRVVMGTVLRVVMGTVLRVVMGIRKSIEHLSVAILAQAV